MEYMEFINQFDSLHLATSSDNIPHSSYSTYIIKDNSFYIFISDIAKHSQNLKTNPYASVMFIDSEENSNNIFARSRVTIDTQANMIQKESKEYQEIIKRFINRYNQEMIQTLSSLDFNIFRLKPISMLTYFGFGKAKEITNIHLEEN
jgi:putative heme iron utilization protein